MFKLHEGEPLAPSPLPDLRPCFIEDEHSARYETHCVHPVSVPEVEAETETTATPEGADAAAADAEADKSEL
jgi:hypothetical protein